MAEDPEKRFHSIMDKLFHSPLPSSSNPSSSSGAQSSRGKKRLNPESGLALVDPRTRGDLIEGSHRSSAVAEVPLCRPWDRGDLMRRASTFKSMTWFAKPQVVSAINCARRGWINVDHDIIACEACGARLLFSTPLSWTQLQVEKAAMVFSLKLENGHKLLCPWIDDACDERLAEFPPTPTPVLVDKFRECCSALLQLSALPLISSSAIEYMKLRSPTLEEFVRQSSVIEYGNESASRIQIETLRVESESQTADLYYQAQKLISLCGWEPRSLPYVVDCKDRQKQSVEDADILNSSHMIANGQNPNISFHSAATSENVETNEYLSAFSGPQSDPNSVVLDCKLCGAVIGLWTFCTVSCPVELFRLVGYTEVNGKKNSGQDSGNGDLVDDREGVVNASAGGTFFSKDRQSNLNLTIAGGPPPTKQNFKATISLPVIGRDLRARLSYDSQFRDFSYDKREHIQSGSENRNRLLDKKDITEGDFIEPVCQSEEGELLMSKTPDQGQCSHANSSPSFSLNIQHSDNVVGCTLEKSTCMSIERADTTGQGETSNIECPTQSTVDIIQGFDQSGGLSDIVKNIGSIDWEVPEKDSRKDQTCSDIQKKLDAHVNSQERNKDRVQIPMNTDIVTYGKDGKQLSLDKSTEFDPIRQHRHFCPWIVSTSSGSPGWQQTLSALQRQRESSDPSSNSPSSFSIIKVDDPITSVRNLFKSPTAKRMKTATGSNRGT